MGTAIGPHSEKYDNKRLGGGAAGKGRTPTRGQTGARGLFRIHKQGQGIHVRWGTAAGAGLLAVAGAFFVSEQIQVFSFGERYDIYVHTLVPVIFLLLAAYFIFWGVGRKQNIVDFMIATEGEMKKVNWSTRKEVWGATKVVIVTVLALGLMLAVVDALFMLLFGTMGVLKNVKLFEIFSGSGEI